jgi:hypothetical protein
MEEEVVVVAPKRYWWEPLERRTIPFGAIAR